MYYTYSVKVDPRDGEKIKAIIDIVNNLMPSGNISKVVNHDKTLQLIDLFGIDPEAIPHNMAKSLDTMVCSYIKKYESVFEFYGIEVTVDVGGWPILSYDGKSIYWFINGTQY